MVYPVGVEPTTTPGGGVFATQLLCDTFRGVVTLLILTTISALELRTH